MVGRQECIDGQVRAGRAESTEGIEVKEGRVVCGNYSRVGRFRRRRYGENGTGE